MYCNINLKSRLKALITVLRRDLGCCQILAFFKILWWRNISITRSPWNTPRFYFSAEITWNRRTYSFLKCSEVVFTKYSSNESIVLHTLSSLITTDQLLTPEISPMRSSPMAIGDTWSTWFILQKRFFWHRLSILWE